MYTKNKDYTMDSKKLSFETQKRINSLAILHDRTVTVLEKWVNHFGPAVCF